MSSTFLDLSSFKTISNKDLINKQQDIEAKLIQAYHIKSLPQTMLDDMETIQKAIEEEIDRRLDDGSMDEDELDEDF